MMQTRNRIFDDMARLAGGAVGLAQGMSQEASTLMRSRVEKMAADLDLVTREEFEAMRELAVAARTESEALAARVEALEAQVSALTKARSED